MSDRNPTKQRRAAQNKSARQALATRTTKASQAPRTPVEPEQGSSRRSRSSARSSSARAASARPARTAEGSARVTPRGGAAKGQGGRPARTAAAVPTRRAPTNPISKAIAEVQAVPGGKGVFFALLFSIVAAALVLFARVTPQEVMALPGDLVEQVRKAKGITIPAGLAKQKPLVGTDYALVVLGPLALLFALAPVVIAGATFAIARKDNRRRNFTVAAFVMFLVVFLAQSLGIYFMFSFGGLVYAAYQARKAEPPTPRVSRRRGPVEQDDEIDDDGFDEDADDEG